MNAVIDRKAVEEKTMEQPTKVILWGREDLVGQGVEYLLKAREDWEVIRIGGDHSTGDLIREVEKINPDVVILYQGDNAANPQLALHLLKISPGIRVITFSLESSCLEVYNRQIVFVNELDDLLDVVN